MGGGWDLTTEDGFLGWYDATVAEASRYAARLCGPDGDLAQDLVQDAYLSVLRRAQRGSLSAAGAGLVVTVIRNGFIDRIRATRAEQRRLRLVADNMVEHPPSDVADPTVGLSPRDRGVLVMRYVDGLSLDEVAAALGVTVHAAESAVTRAKARARERARRHG